LKARLAWFVGFVCTSLGLALVNNGIAVAWDTVPTLDPNLLWFMRYSSIVPSVVGAFTYLGTILNNRGYFFACLGLQSSVFGYLTWLADLGRQHYDDSGFTMDQSDAWKQVLAGSCFCIIGSILALCSAFPHGMRWGEELDDLSHRSIWQTGFMVFSSSVFVTGEIMLWAGQSVQDPDNYQEVQAFVLPHQEVLIFGFLSILAYFLRSSAIDSACCFTLAWQFSQMLLACIYQVPQLNDGMTGSGVNQQDLVRAGFGVVAVGLALLEFNVLFDSQPRLKLYRPDGTTEVVVDSSGSAMGSMSPEHTETVTATVTDKATGQRLSVPLTVVRRPSQAHLEVVNSPVVVLDK